MPGVLNSARRRAALTRRVARYLPYAAGEVILIFLGITLAIAFENSNERRRTNELEIEVLSAIQGNLAANLEEFDENTAYDSGTIGDLDVVLNHLVNRLPWPDSMANRLGHTLRWQQSNLSLSAYESLKQLGIHLVSDQELRRELVWLHEYCYYFLRYDQESTQRAFEESVLLPVVGRELTEADPLGEMADDLMNPRRTLAFRDYEATINRGDLAAALAAHKFRLTYKLQVYEWAREETERVMNLIGEYLTTRG